MINKILKNFLFLFLMAAATSCIVVDVRGAGKFKEPIKHNNRYSVAYIDIPLGTRGYDLRYLDREEKDGSKIGFTYLGSCGGGGMSFSGIMLPIIPIPYYRTNTCEKDGFRVSSKTITDTLGITIQLHYNNKTYDPYIDNGSVKFKIPNFSEFKSATDKTLILHKIKPDGTMWTKELPFDWRVVVEISGGL